MDFKNGVINIQAAGYNGACTVIHIVILYLSQIKSEICFLSHLHSHKIGSMFFWFRIYASAISQEIFTFLLNLVDFLRIWKITRYTVSFNENSGVTPKKIWTHFMYLETVFLKRQIYLQIQGRRNVFEHGEDKYFWNGPFK